MLLLVARTESQADMAKPCRAWLAWDAMNPLHLRGSLPQLRQRLDSIFQDALSATFGSFELGAQGHPPFQDRVGAGMAA